MSSSSWIKQKISSRKVLIAMAMIFGVCFLDFMAHTYTKKRTVTHVNKTGKLVFNIFFLNLL